MNNNTGFKVSVLMLTYNQERYINEAIRSVMLQETNFPFELVIGNDASTDCTGTICADWLKKVPGTNRPIQPEEKSGTATELHTNLRPMSGTIYRHLRGR